MVKKRGLGKSLDALLAYKSSEPQTSVDPDDTSHEKLARLSVDLIQRGKYQPRREMDSQALEDLANSIRAQGIIQPLIVRPVGEKFEIIAGERRWRAAQLAGLSDVPVIIRQIPDEAAIAMALIENIQRENLNPIEEAAALERLIQEFGMTHQQVAEAVGKSRASVTNLLRLLALPEEVKNMLERGLLEMGHARTLITLPESAQLEAAELIISRGLSVRETETLVRQLQSGESGNIRKKHQDPDILHLQESLAKQLKLRVAIHCNAKGRGKLVIHYRSLAELDGILAQFQD
ncbi:putative chromosome-partitioning protein ParB [Aquicella siphonis]|uniref:Probable chromosome-partitioning protein ParB n=1 Tax=Aquicella siphonis TaxID=254247 RepID=A0A5E4PDW9_9COXI|nr:ParB/RepB/Spo0J family partition protein [Aquicella siphonis]VVC74785.1 putative chromosome-partitioning protein ParB [Aquicella siphonis]